ncbi:MAG: hypothetical protein ABIQ81_05350 [Novosphingobium sp.]
MVTEDRYKVTLSREGQPPHQMAEMNTVMSGGILLGIIRAMIEEGDGGLGSSLAGDTPPAFNFGTFKSITISKVDGPH